MPPCTAVPAIALTATLPIACTVASRPNAEPRIACGAKAATAAYSTVTAQPMPTPARANATPIRTITGPETAKERRH